MDKNKTKKIPDEAEEEKLSAEMEKQLSLRKSLFRILIAILAFIWFLVGGSAQTVLSLSGGAMGLSGVVTFLLKNPISFLIIGFINVFLGLILYIFAISFILVSIFHFLWSIRWFYGYRKYRNLKVPQKYRTTDEN
jgi:hypothetical protein